GVVPLEHAARARVSPAAASAARRARVVMVDKRDPPRGAGGVPGRRGVRRPGRDSRLPTPVLTGSGSRVCGCPHSQRPLDAPLSFPARLHRGPIADSVGPSGGDPAVSARHGGRAMNERTQELLIKGAGTITALGAAWLVQRAINAVWKATRG